MTTQQLFCTVNDLILDKQAPVDEERMYKAIREASDYLQKELGWFIPVTLTRRFNGHGKTRLFPGALLAITSIVNDGTTLSPSDYILKPDHGMWAYGPYVEILVDPDAANLSSWVCEDDGVEIAGRWGKYQRSGSIGATVQDNPQTNSQSTLKVSDGSKVSPGMTLLIESEQQLVTGWSTPTANATTLGANVAAGDETISVADGNQVNIGEIIRSTFEQMKVKDKQTNTLEVTRGWNGTRRVTHTSGAAVDVYRTVTVDRGVNGTTAAEHAQNTAISRYFVPDDVNFLCKEIATLIAKKAGSGYQGRTGNAETGVVFYNDAFPKFDIERVKEVYYIPKAPSL